MQEPEAMVTPAKHISVVKTFSSGDVDKWFCCLKSAAWQMSKMQ